jgi:hypothetical protein
MSSLKLVAKSHENKVELLHSYWSSLWGSIPHYAQRNIALIKIKSNEKSN